MMWGIHCKHRLNIFKGQTKAIVSDNKKEVKTIVSWMAGSDVEAALLALDEAEKDFNKIVKEYKDALIEYDSHVDMMQNKPTKQREKIIEKAKDYLMSVIERRAIIKSKRTMARKALDVSLSD